MTRTITLALAALIASTALAPAAMAGKRVSEPVSLSIFYGDLDVSTQAGGVALLKRVKKAASRVCGGTSVRRPVELDFFSTCRDQTIAQTVRQLDVPTVTMAWQGQQTSTRLASN